MSIPKITVADQIAKQLSQFLDSAGAVFKVSVFDKGQIRRELRRKITCVSCWWVPIGRVLAFQGWQGGFPATAGQVISVFGLAQALGQGEEMTAIECTIRK